MARRILRAAILTLMTLAIVAALVVGVAFWRLAQGPVSLAFMNDSIESAINQQLNGLTISLGEAVLELDPETRIPSVRTRNLVLRDSTGETLAKSPKAGVTLDKQAILGGEIVVRSLDLIGPKVNLRRNLDGSFSLGISGAAADAEEVVEVNESEMTADPQVTAPAPAGRRLLDLLGVGTTGGGALTRLDDIRVTRAELTIYDEANDATWYAPRADLAFKRMDYGFLLVAKTEVASTGQPWQAEMSTTYKAAENVYGVNITISDLVPANVADKVYALSQFAKLKMPFSGHIEMDITGAGNIARASGELFAAAGELNLPDYFAKPILVDEGAFRLAYSTDSDQLRILDSSLLVGGSRAEISGDVTARRQDDGRLIAFDINLLAQNVNVDAVGDAKQPVDIDRIEFKGAAFVDSPEVEIADMVVMSGATGIRMRGKITGGEESAGIQMAGRLRDVDSELLKQIWPPVLTPKTRAWIAENIIEGRITEGTFQVSFPVNGLARMLRDRVMPKGAVDLAFSMDGVKSRYFKSLPPLTAASGKARLVDENFTLVIDQGQATLDDGKKVSLAKGMFKANNIMLKEVPGTFEFDIQGSVPAMLAFAAHPDVNLAPADASAAPKLEGKARALIGLEFPLIKGVPKERVKVTTKVSIEDASIANVSPGINLTDGNFDIAVTKEDITVSGPAKLNGVSSKVVWQKPRGKGNATTALETIIDAKMRDKLGLKLDDYMSGSVPVRVNLGAPTDAGREIEVEADLSGVAMKLAVAGWSRPAIKGTKATFVVLDNGKDGRKIKDIKLDGPGLRIRGDVTLKDKVIEAIRLSEIKLEEDDIFTANLYPGDGVMNLELTGTSIDARPYIKNILSPAKNPEEAASEAPKGQNFIVSAKFKKVIAYRGETVSSVEATLVTQKGQIKTARIEGLFESGKPITIRLTPTESGRKLTVASIDGGAVLRATNFYGKIAGGQLEFEALIENRPGSPIRNGLLKIANFAVRNEAALAELDERGKPKKSGPRVEGVTFKRVEVPFTTDSQFVRLCGVSLRGAEMGGTASGLIRKRDGAIDITGTYFPLSGINVGLNKIPLFSILTGGKREGLLGITYAMGGTTKEPKFEVNPFSLILPGFLRKIAEYEQNACRKPKASAAN